MRRIEKTELVSVKRGCTKICRALLFSDQKGCSIRVELESLLESRIPVLFSLPYILPDQPSCLHC
jgi:hypothetical protein